MKNKIFIIMYIASLCMTIFLGLYVAIDTQNRLQEQKTIPVFPRYSTNEQTFQVSDTVYLVVNYSNNTVMTYALKWIEVDSYQYN